MTKPKKYRPFNGVDLRTSEWLKEPAQVRKVQQAIEGLHEDYAGLFNEFRYLMILGQLEGSDPKLTYESLARLIRPYVHLAEATGVIWACEVTPL